MVGKLKTKIKNWLSLCCLHCGETKIHSLLVEMQNGTATLKNSLAVSYWMKYTLTNDGTFLFNLLPAPHSPTSVFGV